MEKEPDCTERGRDTARVIVRKRKKGLLYSRLVSARRKLFFSLVSLLWLLNLFISLIFRYFIFFLGLLDRNGVFPWADFSPFFLFSFWTRDLVTFVTQLLHESCDRRCGTLNRNCGV